MGSKGTKKFFQQRKRQILSLNREQYEAENDEVQMSAAEYQEMRDKRE